MDQQTALKKKAGEFAADFVQSGMRIGLGTGSTAVWAVRRIGEKLRSGELADVVAIPTSIKTQQEAEKVGIPLASFDVLHQLDLTIDGADEVDNDLNLIKGGGGALLREKIVAQITKRFMIIVDPRKLVPALGTTWALPIEVAQFGWESQFRFLESIGGKPILRKTDVGDTFLTDGGNIILDTDFGPIPNVAELEAILQRRVGLLENGLFVDMATDLVVAAEDGVEHYQGLIS